MSAGGSSGSCSAAEPPAGKDSTGSPGDVRAKRRALCSRLLHADPSGGPATDIDALIRADLTIVVAVVAVALLVLLIAVLVLLRRTRALSARLTALTRGEDGSSIEDVLGSHLRRVHEVARGLDDLDTRTAVLERDLRRAFGRVGLVRYNPFEDTGGNQSFALAVLDGHGDGFVMSSLHARQGTRIYAKAISGGTSSAGLSAEETEALRQALAARGAAASGTETEARTEATARASR